MSDQIDFSVEEAEETYRELGALQIVLDDDPVRFGPKRLNNKIAEARRMLDRCEAVFLSVSRQLHLARRAFRSAQTDLDLAKKHLFSTDPETRSGRSVSDREATATGKLIKEVREVARLETVVADLESVLTVIRAKRADLRDAQGRLRDQVRMCVEEIGLGSRWGSQVPGGGNSLSQAKPVSPEDKELVDTLAQIEGQVQLSRETGNWTDPEDLVEVSIQESPSVIIATPLPQKTEETEVESTEQTSLVGVSPFPRTHSTNLSVSESISNMSASDGPALKTVVEMLPGTDVTTQSLDAFLETGIMTDKVKVAEKQQEDLTDQGLDDILASFESPLA